MPISFGRIFHRASTDMSISESSDDFKPIMATRLVDDSGWIITGGVPTLGSATACDSRSCVICRALRMSVPGSKTRSMDDSPVTDSELMCFSHGMPLSRSCSSGTVISCSTSAADSPRASVWICTDGGVNCG